MIGNWKLETLDQLEAMDVVEHFHVPIANYQCVGTSAVEDFSSFFVPFASWMN